MNDFAEKYRLVRELFVASPYLSSLMDEFDECLQDSKLGGAAQCMLVTGNTGSGKTSLINKYIENYPRNELTDRTKVPVLFTSLPENATPIRASQAMLSDLGDPFCYSSNDSEALKKRLITLLKNCQVDLIFIDEFQHLIERKNNKVLHRAADWLKMIIVESNIPVILFGMPYSTVILDVNSQLNGRILFKRKLIPFQINDNHERQNFLKFLKVFDQGLPFEQSSELWNENIAIRLYSFSSGNLRKLRDLLNQACRFALEESALKVSYEHFEKAATKIDRDCPLFVNPFSIKDLTSIKINEPDLDVGWEDFKNKAGEISFGKPNQVISVSDIFDKK